MIPKKFHLAITLAIFLSIPFAGISQCNPLPTPFLENFQSIQNNNQLPLCWAASSPSQACLTYSSTNSYAAFYNSSNVAYFFSPEMQILSSQPYTVSLKYMADAFAASTWTNISVYRNTTQSTAGMTLVASFTPSVNSNYQTLSNLTSFNPSGNYYFIIAASASQTTQPSYLYWDDFEIKAMCGPPMTLNVPVPGICVPHSATLTVFGLGSGPYTYSWSNCSTTQSIVVSPTVTTTYTGIASNSITSCPANIVTPTVNILPPMTVMVAASKTTVCIGQSVILIATGAGSYLWSTNQTGPQITVIPQANTIYTVLGSTSICEGTAAITINTAPSPTVTISPASATLCKGESIILSATGASSFLWMGGINTPTINLTPGSTALYVVNGIDANMCSNAAAILLTVDDCTGIDRLEENSPIKILADKKTLMINFEKAEKAVLSVFAIDGKLLYYCAFQAADKELMLGDLTEQVLIIQLTTEEKTYRKKILIE